MLYCHFTLEEMWLKWIVAIPKLLTYECQNDIQINIIIAAMLYVYIL